MTLLRFCEETENKNEVREALPFSPSFVSVHWGQREELRKEVRDQGSFVVVIAVYGNYGL
jgi:hypothetical protein